MAGSTPSTDAPEGQPHIGVLALQGAFREHVRMLRRLGAKVTEVRLPRDLEGLDGLMIPGGESTTIGLLLEEYKLMEPLRDFVKAHPVFGTCAGLIMLAKHTTDGEQPLLRVMDITVRRNAFGRQLRSFEGPVELSLGAAAAGGAAAAAVRTRRACGARARRARRRVRTLRRLSRHLHPRALGGEGRPGSGGHREVRRPHRRCAAGPHAGRGLSPRTQRRHPAARVLLGDGADSCQGPSPLIESARPHGADRSTDLTFCRISI